LGSKGSAKTATVQAPLLPLRGLAAACSDQQPVFSVPNTCNLSWRVKTRSEEQKEEQKEDATYSQNLSFKTRKLSCLQS
jgi:hypothetical protein